MSFPDDVLLAAWKVAGPEWSKGGKCERCWKTLSWKNRGEAGAWGAWEAHPKTSMDAGGSDTVSSCEILCLSCYKATREVTPYPSLEELETKAVQAKRDFGEEAKRMFSQGKNTVEIAQSLGIQDLPFEMLIEVLGFSNIKEWERAASRIRQKQRAKDKEGRTLSKQRKKCLQRDNYQCVACGKEARNVHHMIPYLKSHSHKLDNLVSLCDLHHDAIHCNLSMYQQKQIDRVKEYIKAVNKRFGKSLILAPSFETKAGTTYYHIREQN
ncbi:hypothetical protein GTO27_13450 [Candidatus Bathyarchaeota archaeon]|nr:hypothetical protein [Candidatus Bathyarchaeota archaeon]